MGQFEHPGRAAGIVVGPGMNRPDLPQAAAMGAVAEVVVVGRDEDVLFLQFRIAAGEYGQDVAASGGEGLEVAAVGAGPLEVELGVLLGEVIAGGVAAAGARPAPLQGVAGQVVDVPGQLLGMDRLQGGGVRRGSFRAPRDARHKHAGQQGRQGQPGYRGQAVATDHGAVLGGNSFQYRTESGGRIGCEKGPFPHSRLTARGEIE